LVGIVALAWFEKYGHTPVALLGGATGKIGDPSGKSHERPLLSKEILEENVAAIKKQFEKCLKNPDIINNDQWLADYPLVDFLRDVGKHFRLGPMLGKDSVRSRLQSEEGISFTEFSYQVLQGYDFYHLFQNEGISLQMGGVISGGILQQGLNSHASFQEKRSMDSLTLS